MSQRTHRLAIDRICSLLLSCAYTTHIHIGLASIAICGILGRTHVHRSIRRRVVKQYLRNVVVAEEWECLLQPSHEAVFSSDVLRRKDWTFVGVVANEEVATVDLLAEKLLGGQVLDEGAVRYGKEGLEAVSRLEIGTSTTSRVGVHRPRLNRKATGVGFYVVRPGPDRGPRHCLTDFRRPGQLKVWGRFTYPSAERARL